MNFRLVLRILLCSTVVLSSCKMRGQKDSNTKKKVVVSFEKESKLVNEKCNNFSISLSSEDGSYKHQLSLDGCHLRIPKIPDSHKYLNVIFKYQELEMKFEKIETNLLFQDQKLGWNFILDLPPYEYKDETIESKGLIAIHILQFDPHEFGQGIEIVNPIYK